LVKAGIELFRRKGYIATTVDEICEEAGVTKGAFFHHYASKEALGEACLKEWDCMTAAMEEMAPFHAVPDPLARLLACIDFYIGLFENPGLLKSCLAGTTVQEVSETHPILREAAHACFVSAESRLKAMLDEACEARNLKLDTASLAALWMAAIQGALVLCKASGDESVIGATLKHVRAYIASLFLDSRT